LVGGIRRAGVKALTTCELQALSRRNLNILILEYPDVGEELKRVAKDRAKVVKQERRSSQTVKANLETKKYNRVGSNIVDSR
jgi:CRP-like cAMP-binding protein